MTCLFIARLIFIATLWDKVSERALPVLFIVLQRGMRFDLGVASYLTIPSLVLLSIPFTFIDRESCSKVIRRWWAFICLIIVSVTTIVAIHYYREYNDLFNQMLFGLIYDDAIAVAKTIALEFPIYRILLTLIVGLILGFILSGIWFKKVWFSVERICPVDANKWHCNIFGIFTTGILLLLFVIALRGSIEGVPIQRRHIEVTTDPFLNRAIFGNIRALYDAIRQKLRRNTDAGFADFYDGTPSELVAELFPGRPPGLSLDRYLQRKASEPHIKPRHIFLIVAESYSYWPLLEKYHNLGLANGMLQLAKEGGVIIPNFLPASTGTMTSLSTLITGLADVDLVTNYVPFRETPLPSSLPRQLKELGFITRFFYGGSGTWQRVSDFLAEQGVDELYSVGNIGSLSGTDIWGLPDEELFNFVQKQVASEQPSFNLILTVSNHPPYSIDLKQKGFDLDAFEARLARDYPESAPARHLAHYWYGDKTISEFVRKANRLFPESLFVVTGDHYARNKHVLPNPPLYETEAVLLSMFGDKEIMQQISFPEGVVGSHLDLVATLLELVTPPGSDYYALGRNMMEDKTDHMAIGRYIVASPNFISRLDQLPKGQNLSGIPHIASPQISKNLSRYHSLISGFSWLRTREEELLDSTN